MPRPGGSNHQKPQPSWTGTHFNLETKTQTFKAFEDILRCYKTMTSCFTYKILKNQGSPVLFCFVLFFPLTLETTTSPQPWLLFQNTPTLTFEVSQESEQGLQVAKQSQLRRQRCFESRDRRAERLKERGRKSGEHLFGGRAHTFRRLSPSTGRVPVIRGVLDWGMGVRTQAWIQNSLRFICT